MENSTANDKTVMTDDRTEVKKSKQERRKSTTTTTAEEEEEEEDRRTKEILRQFFETTTAHGWGQMARAYNYPVKAIWLLLTLAAFAINVTHVTILVSQYLRFPYEQVTRVTFLGLGSNPPPPVPGSTWGG